MRHLLWISAALALTSGACKRKADPKHDPGSAAADPAAIAAACEGAEAKGPLAWHEDAYDRALACARARGVPVVIDMWAPWCHTCISMQTTVLRDPSLAPFADRFVFVAIDTDKEANAAAVGKYALQNWPTFFVIDPTTEAVQARWLGAASAPQVRELLKDGETAYLAGKAGTALDPLLAGVRDGAQAANQKDWKTARAAWAKVIQDAPADWSRRSDVLVSLIAAMFKDKAYPECLQLVQARTAETGASANTTDFLLWGLECAAAEGVDPAQAKAVRETAALRLAALVADAAAPLSADDRSDAMLNLREAYEALGRKDEAKATAEQQLAFLTAAAAKAPDAFARMAYNWPRAEVHIYLGRGAELVPALEQSGKDLPTEYDPPYRLAWVLMKSGEPARALPAAKDAASKAYGTRKVRVQGFVVEVAKAIGDRAEELAARRELVAVLEGLPKEAAQPDALAKARAELAAFESGTATAPDADAGSAAPAAAAAAAPADADAGAAAPATAQPPFVLPSHRAARGKGKKPL